VTDPSTSTPTVFVVDDDEAVRKSLAWLIGSVGLAVKAYESADAFLASWAEERPGCLVLDVRMPGMSGLELQDALARRGSSLPVIIVTGHADVPMAVRAIRAGAADFVEKPFSAVRLLESIRGAIARRAPSATAADPALRQRFADLTPREREVLEQMVIGLPNKLIAHRLGMSPRTVEIHRGRVMQKTGANSLSHLVRMAVRAGLDPEA
jgi:two-component system response regulator FixJ